MADERHQNREMGGEGTLVPWLRGVPLPSRPVSAQPSPSGSAAAAASSDAGLPDWLRELQDTVADGATDEPPAEPPPAPGQMPDWLASLSAETTSAPAAPAAALPPDDRGVPDWLREIAADDEPPATPPAPPPAPAASGPSAGMTSWLRGLGDTPEEIPAPEPPPPPKPPTRSPLRMPSGATDWLRSLGEETDPNELPPPPQRPNREPQQPLTDDEAIPSWLREISSEELERDLADVAPAGPPTDLRDPGSLPAREEVFDAPSWLAPDAGTAREQPGESDIPDWLRSAAAPPPFDGGDDRWDVADQPRRGEAAPEPPADDLPDWLRSAASERSPLVDDEPSTVAPWLGQDDKEAPAPTAPGDLLAAREPTLPDWLSSGPPHESSTAAHAGGEDPLPGWLRADEPPPLPPTPAAPPAGRGDDLPDWLRADEPPTPAAPPSRGGDDLPDWLRADEPPTPAAPPSRGGDDLPDWLRADEPPPPAAVPPSGRGDDLPDWLRADEPPPLPPTPAAPAAAGRDDLPDWLRIDATQTEPAPTQRRDEPFAGGATSQATPSWADDDQPDWLRPLADTPTQPAATPPARGETDLPDWLRADVSDTPAAPVPPPAGNTLPDWLQGGEMGSGGRDAGLPTWLRGAEAETPTRPMPAPTPSASSADAPTLPPWLRDEATTDVARDEGQRSGSDFLGLGGADLPSWLRSPDAPAPTEAATSAPAEETYTDWLARLRTQQDEEADSDVAVVEPTGAIAPLQRPVYAVRPERMGAIALLQRLVADPFPTPADAPAVEATQERRRFGLEQALYLLLLLALLGGLLAPQLVAPFQGPISAPGAAPLAQVVEGLGENDVVLVAYEWDVRRRGELASLEQAVMSHLAQRKVKFVFVSTDLQGTLLAYDARDRLINEFGYRPRGLDYILLGYKPGGELGLRQLAQNLPRVLASDFQGADANQSAVALDVATGQPRLTSISDFAMVLVMADDAQDVQGWMEQVRPQMSSETPLALLMPAETTPVVQPYLRMPGVLGLSGRLGALGYDQQRGGEVSAAATAASGQVPFAIASFVLLLLLGAVVGGILAAAQRRRAT